jgi:antitoxin YokJ
MLDALIAKIRQTPACQVYPPSGMPVIQPDHRLPDDLTHFYTVCGGLELFRASLFPTIICPPQKLVVANPVIWQGLKQELVDETQGHPSWAWYIVAECPDETDQWVTIDLSPSHLGRCYDSQFFIHPGNSYVIAPSFTELLARLIADKGEDRFWWNIPPEQHQPAVE